MENLEKFKKQMDHRGFVCLRVTIVAFTLLFIVIVLLLGRFFPKQQDVSFIIVLSIVTTITIVFIISLSLTVRYWEDRYIIIQNNSDLVSLAEMINGDACYISHIRFHKKEKDVFFLWRSKNFVMKNVDSEKTKDFSEENFFSMMAILNEKNQKEVYFKKY